MMHNTRLPSPLPKSWIILGFILLLGLGLRAVLVPSGLPFLLYEDESIYLTKIMAFGYGDFNPHYFKKPTFFLYFHFAFFYLHYLFALLSGTLTSWAEFENVFWQEPSAPVICARSLSLLFSTASIGLVYAIGKRVFSATVGLSAAFLLAMYPTHIKLTPILISDIPALFFILLACWFALNIYDKGRWRDYLACAVAIGLTMSFKYNFFSAGFLVAAHSLRCWPKGSPLLPALKKVVLDRKLWIAFLGAGLVFVTLSPYVLLNFGQFYEHFAFERDHVLQRTMGLKRSAKAFVSLPKLLFKIMPRDASWGLHVLNLLGMLALGLTPVNRFFKKLFPAEYDWKKGWILLAFPLIFFLVIAQFRLVNAKYLLPLTPFLLLSGMALLSGLTHQLVSRVKAPAAWLTPVLLSFLLLTVSQPLWSKALASSQGHLNATHLLPLTQKKLVLQLTLGQRLLIEKHTFPARSLPVLQNSLPGITLLQMGQPETTVGTVKSFQPDYVLINPQTIRDGEGHNILRFPPDYYAYLRQHFETVGIFTPYGTQAIIDYPSDAEDYLALYQAVAQYGKHHKSIPTNPGPVLLLLKKS